MSPLHSQTSVPQHGPERWWVRKGLMIPGKNNSKPNTARRAPAQSSHECFGAGFLAAASRCHGRSAPLNRDGVVTARRKGTDPLTQFEHASWTRVKEALDKAKIQAWFTQRYTTKHVLTHPSLDRKATISQTTFQMNSRQWRVSYFDLIFTDVYS